MLTGNQTDLSNKTKQNKKRKIEEDAEEGGAQPLSQGHSMLTCSLLVSHDLWLGRSREFSQALRVLLLLHIHIILHWFHHQVPTEELKQTNILY